MLQLPIREQLSHGRQVSNLAYETGREMGLAEEDCRDLIIAGFFHDIGKIELQNEERVLSDRLIVDEMNSVREHPLRGCEILRRHGYPETVWTSVLYHHENYDGSGYPENREGRDIPTGACILRVCEQFCALTTDRPYRDALSYAQAMEKMIEEIRKYDLHVFLAFQRVMHRAPDGGIQMPEVSDYVKGVWKTL